MEAGGAYNKDVRQLRPPSLTPSPVVRIAPRIPTPSMPATSHTPLTSACTTGPKILNAFSTAQIPQHLTIAYNMQQRNTHAEGSEVTGSMTIVNPVSVSSGVGNGGNTNSFHVDDVRVVNSLNVRCSTAVSGTIDLSVSSDEESPQEMCLRSDHLNVDHVSEPVENTDDRYP
ncbi:unnamed protein product [Heterobilharzia americana]|nr:unnamed protein product [Heterobilharzia americana]